MTTTATLNAVNGNNVANEYDVTSSQFSGSDTGLLPSMTYWVNVTVQSGSSVDSFWVSAVSDPSGNLAWSLPGNLSNLADGSYTVNAATYASAPVNNQPQGTAVVATSYTSPNLTIDTNASTISSVTASGSGIDSNGNGLVTTGKTVTLTVHFSESVIVNTSAGTPTLTLNDGGIATYTGGSGSNALTFSYTAQSGQNAAALAVSAFNLNSATIQDDAGNNAILPTQATSTSGTVEVNTSGHNEIIGNFNGTAVPAGDVIWFTAVLKAGGSPGNETFTFASSHIYLTNGSAVYDIVVPNAVITYSNTTTAASTTYDASTNTWITNLPGNANLAGNVFLTAVPFVVPVGGLPGGSKATWSIVDPQTNVSGATAQWQWAAAVYTSFNTANYNALNVKAVDDTHYAPWGNSDHAGTPEAYKQYVVGGATGGGGSNYTGSYSGTASFTFVQPPTLTTPVITGTAQEGQTLTASATSGPNTIVTYQWVENNGPGGTYQNISGATGNTYLVKEADEGFKIEVVATATNLYGATTSATSTPTSNVLDNSSISLSVSVVANGSMQQGQTLVATPTLGDADDATAAVTYQWQSSSDGGQTWTNVAATAAGGFGGTVPSSFYQLTEDDEGKQFRVVASFTDDTGQIVTATSAPTAKVADVTPEITVPFSYAVDELSIVKNGTQIYDNTFSQAPPASSTILSSGNPTPIAFITEGSTWTESNGKAIASSTGVALNSHINGGNSVYDIALLNTNTDPSSNLGLKENASFTVSSKFDLTVPPTGNYGMELTDGTSTHGIDQLVRLLVARGTGGSTVVELVQRDLTQNPQTNNILATQTLTAAQLAGNTQIELDLSHVANSTAITGSFELINNGTITSTTTFGPTATIFTNGVDWTRADVGAFANTGVGLSGQAREGQTLAVSASANDSDATLHYQWQKSTDNFATFSVIGTDSSTYVVQEADEGFNIRVVARTADPDNSQTASVTSTPTGPVLDAAPTVTTPIITGTAQEGQTLTVSASAGESDDPVAYAWYSSADGFTNPIGTGATYLVKETDETWSIEAKATATNDNGVAVTAASAATSAVLDAAPTVSTPIITGTAQEGQTLTASASAGEGDDAVTYAWYSSAGGFNSPIGTGSTYLVKEADENSTIEVVATATNDNVATATATSAATSKVLDNSSLALTVSVVANGGVQEGQTLVASAVPSDADDAGAPVAYQWQSSSDGGQTWVNVAETTSANFNGGVLSSFYQLTEGDEGKQFRAVASFTDDTGRLITAISTPTANVADVTPVITVPFTYAVDELSIVKNNNLIYDNTFSVAPPASSTILSNNVPTPIVFITQGSTWTVSGGKAIASSTGVAVNGNVTPSSTFDLALLNTNTDPTSTSGLKLGASFTVSSKFDLIAPANVGGNAYGMELTDGTSTHGSDQLVRLLVANVNGTPTVELVQRDLTQNPQTINVLATQSLTAAQLAGNNQIELDLSHVANSTAITGRFELINNGTVTSTTTFGPTGTSFTNGVNWTRADVGAFVNPGVGLSVGPAQSPREGQTLTASASTNDSDAALHYQWQSSLNFTTWTNIAGAADGSTYVVQEGDEGRGIRVVASTTDPDNTTTASVTSVATGQVKDLLPTPATPTISGNAIEGQTLTASSVTTGSDEPLSILYQWQTSSDGSTWSIIPTATSPTYTPQEGDENQFIRISETFTDDSFQSVTLSSAAVGRVLDAAPTVTTPVITGTAQEGQTLTASASAGESDDAVTYAWYSSADGFSNAIGAGATYLVQEGDEGFTLEAKATDTNDNGVTTSATATTGSVLDAAPSVTTPTITGTAQEGQTLTASASAGESDDAVTYAWYNSADGFTNAIGTGSTYLVQEGDENATIEVVATATNDDSVTVSAASTPTASVLDNSSLALTVQVVAGGSVQQGQTLVASAIPSDADDAGATVTYQWQNSGDGGGTWTNVAATGAGNFNGVLSSFYQFSEGDEGKEFRAVASFTDDTGQVVSATSTPTAAVADVTPEVTVPFSYAVDELSIIKNGTQIYMSDFTQAPVASATILSGGVPTPIVFITQGSTWTTSGGKAIASSTGVAVNPNTGGGNSVFDLALLNTNTNPTSTSGLKEGADFTVTSKFDLVVPTTGSYGTELTDGTATHPIDQLERLLVQRIAGGAAQIQLIQANLTTNTQTVLASHTLTSAELGANNEIEFQFTHSANSTQVTGAYALGSNGSFGALNTFAPTATAFTSSVDWTRADVGAFTSVGVGLNITPGASPQSGQTLSASASTNDSDATIHYQWQSSPDGTTWTAIAGAADSASYVVQGSDEDRDIRVAVSTTDPDNSQTASVNSNATGPVTSPEAPVLGGATSASVTVSHQVTLGATDTVRDADDTLGNVTITGLPGNLSNFNGGTYTSATGTWTGTAAQFNALTFTAGTTAATYNLSIAATTTGAEAATTTESYTLTVKPMNVLLSGNQMDSAIQSDLAAYGISSTIVAPGQLQNTDFSQYSGIWLSWETTYDNTSGQLAGKFSNFINAGGDVFAEEAFTNELSFLPNGGSISTSTLNADDVNIVNSFGSLMNNLTSAGLSGWGNSYHDTYTSIGPFTGVDQNSSGAWVTIAESIGQGNLTITGQDPSFHIQFGAGATGAGSPKAQFAVNALSLGPNHTDPPVGTVSDVAFSGASVDLISNDTSPVLELGPSASDNVAFDPETTNGVLQLDSSATFSGQIALFAPGDTLDLRDIGFGTGTALGYSGDTSGGTLTVSDGTTTANIALLGQYSAASFVTASDGNGGTAITVSPAGTGQDQLTASH